MFTYLGITFLIPSTFLAGIQNEANNFGDLTESGLVENDTFGNFMQLVTQMEELSLAQELV